MSLNLLFILNTKLICGALLNPLMRLGAAKFAKRDRRDRSVVVKMATLTGADLSKLRVVDLKEHLSERGLSTSGESGYLRNTFHALPDCLVGLDASSSVLLTL